VDRRDDPAQRAEGPTIRVAALEEELRQLVEQLMALRCSAGPSQALTRAPRRLRAGPSTRASGWSNARSKSGARVVEAPATRADTTVRPIASVPFDNPRNQIVVQATIGGAGPFNFLLDTATDPSGFDLDLADSLGFAVHRESGRLAVGTGSLDVRIYPTGVGGLSLGGVAFDTFPSMASGFLSGLGERLGRPLHGILGVSFLEDKAVVIDYPDRMVHIYDRPLPIPSGPNVVTMPMARNGNDIVIPDFQVNGRPVRVTLDTGSSLTLSIYAPAATRLGLDSLRASARGSTVRGYRGEASLQLARADSIGLGPLVVRHAEISFPERDGATDRNLGNGYLQGLILTLDYLSDRVSLERPSGAPSM
jgi:hypothetical protein